MSRFPGKGSAFSFCASAALGLIPLIALCSTGCSREVEYAAVEGKVTMNGVPQPDIQVIFYPDPQLGGKGPRSVSLTDGQGIYRLTDDDGRSGIVVGVCRVCLTDARTVMHHRATPGGSDKNDEPRRSPSRVQAKFSDSNSTPFKAIEVKPGSGKFDFDLGSASVNG